MPLQGIKTVAVARNGVGAFILPCRRLDLHYCDWAGSSHGLNTFLKSPLLAKLAKHYPQTEFRVSPRPHRHPVLKAYYINGREKAICVRNLSREQVMQKAEILMNSSGLKNKKQRGKPNAEHTQHELPISTLASQPLQQLSGFNQTITAIKDSDLREWTDPHRHHEPAFKNFTHQNHTMADKEEREKKRVTFNLPSDSKSNLSKGKEECNSSNKNGLRRQEGKFSASLNLAALGRKQEKEQKK